MSWYMRMFRPLPRTMDQVVRHGWLRQGSGVFVAMADYKGASPIGHSIAMYNITGRRPISTGNWHGKEHQNPLAEQEQEEHKEQEQKKKRENHHGFTLNPKKAEVTPLERHLVEFLTGEIIEERRIQLKLNAPLLLDDYVAIFRGSEVELVKTTPKERVTIVFNVSKSVPPTVHDESTPMRSVPKFEVLIKRDEVLLALHCQFFQTAFKDDKVVEPEPNQKYADMFYIKDVSLYEHDCTDRSYTIEASLFVDDLYDLLMDMLAEVGITNEFVEKVSDLATAHEHASYIEFLENLSKFAVGPPPPLGGDDGGTE